MQEGIRQRTREVESDANKLKECEQKYTTNFEQYRERATAYVSDLRKKHKEEVNDLRTKHKEEVDRLEQETGSWEVGLPELLAEHEESITVACNDLTQHYEVAIKRVTDEYSQDRLLDAQEQEQRNVEDEALLQVLLKDVEDEHNKDLLLQHQELTQQHTRDLQRLEESYNFASTESANDAKTLRESIHKRAQVQQRHQWATEVYFEELDEDRDKQFTLQQELLAKQHEDQLQTLEQAVVSDYTEDLQRLAKQYKAQLKKREQAIRHDHTQDLQRLEEQISAMTLSHSKTVDKLKRVHDKKLTKAKRIYQYDVAEQQKRIYDLESLVGDMDKLLISRDLSQDDVRERLTRNITKDVEEFAEWGFLYMENEYFTYLYTFDEECEAEIQDIKDAAAKDQEDSQQEVNDLEDEMLEIEHQHSEQLEYLKEKLRLAHGQDLVHQGERYTALDLQTTAKQHEIERKHAVSLAATERYYQTRFNEVLKGIDDTLRLKSIELQDSFVERAAIEQSNNRREFDAECKRIRDNINSSTTGLTYTNAQLSMELQRLKASCDELRNAKDTAVASAANLEGRLQEAQAAQVSREESSRKLESLQLDMERLRGQLEQLSAPTNARNMDPALGETRLSLVNHNRELTQPIEPVGGHVVVNADETRAEQGPNGNGEDLAGVIQTRQPQERAGGGEEEEDEDYAQPQADSNKRKPAAANTSSKQRRKPNTGAAPVSFSAAENIQFIANHAIGKHIVCLDGSQMDDATKVKVAECVRNWDQRDEFAKYKWKLGSDRYKKWCVTCHSNKANRCSLAGEDKEHACDCCKIGDRPAGILTLYKKDFPQDVSICGDIRSAVILTNTCIILAGFCSGAGVRLWE